jgi:hypothetical protein
MTTEQPGRAAGSWRTFLFGTGSPRRLSQVVAKIVFMAAVLIPGMWAIGGDLKEALRYTAIFLGVISVVDLALLWNNRRE